jgi:hypothetical protein
MSTPGKRPTRAERRAAEERRRRIATMQEASLGGSSDPLAPTPVVPVAPVAPAFTPPTAPSVQRHHDVEPTPSVRGWLRVAIGSLLVIAGSVVAFTFALPTFGHDWEPVWLAPAAVLYGIGLWVLWAWKHHSTRRAWRASVAVAMVASLLYGYGAFTQVVVNGVPYWSGSYQAQAYRLGSEMVRDLLRIDALDAYIVMPDSQARSYRAELLRGRDEMTSIADRWNPAERRVPSAYEPVLRHLNAASSAAAQAADLRAANLIEPDAARANQVTQLRAAYYQEVLAAGQALGNAAAADGIDLSGTVKE